MKQNYLKIAWRILIRNKANTTINVIGLGLGFSLSMLMMIYVWHQLSYDTFHRNYNKISRLIIDVNMPDGNSVNGPFTAGDIAGFVKEGVPGVEAICRIYDEGLLEVLVNEQRFPDQNLLWADPDFFLIFDFPLISGNAHTALSEPNTMVITRKLSERYFGSEDPIGKTLWAGRYQYQITGVAKDLPLNSHLQFGMLASFSTLTQPGDNIVQRNGISFYTYLLQHQETDKKPYSQDVITVADRHINERFGPHGLRIAHSLQPLSRVYLHSDFSFGNATGGNMISGDVRNVYIFSFLALVVILIAVFNFVNLITAQSEKRTREIGMRKVMGAQRIDMIFQFIGESLLLTTLAFVFSLLLNEIFIEPFSQILDENFRLEYWYEPGLLFIVLGFVSLTGVLAGLYPALYMSRYQPVRVLKGLVVSRGRTYLLRRFLVSAQFTISIFLVISVLLLNRQVKYMKNRDIGFDRENVVTLRRLTPALQNAYPALKTELLQNPSILSVTASMVTPGEPRGLQTIYKKGDDPNNSILISGNWVLDDYFDTFKMQIVDGEDFQPLMRMDLVPLILNQSAVRQLGLDEPVGQEVIVWNEPARIVGVVRDYNFTSMHHSIEPLALLYSNNMIRRISIRITPGNVPQTLSWIQERLETTDENYSFDYSFVSETFSAMYRKEDRINKLVTAAAILAIIISFMGLYALTSFSIIKRTKEIGIRKTLGAPAASILILLFRDLKYWVILSNLIAWPVAAYVISRWQENFAFRIQLLEYWYLFMFAGVLAALVGALATLIHALGALRASPVNSLKTE